MDEIYEADEGVGTDAANTDVIEEELPKENEQTDGAEAPEDSEYTDYEAIVASDVSELSSEFPELKGLKDITELNNPLRYAALRDLGLTPREAYLATAKRPAQDTRAHLRAAHGRSAAAGVGMMSQEELARARDLFPSLSDRELHKLYKRVTK